MTRLCSKNIMAPSAAVKPDLGRSTVPIASASDLSEGSIGGLIRGGGYGRTRVPVGALPLNNPCRFVTRTGTSVSTRRRTAAGSGTG